MYNFIFYFFYKLIEKRNPAPIYNAATTVMLAQIFHSFMFIAIIKYYGNFVIPRFYEGYIDNKMAMFPFALVWLLIVTQYYKKKGNDILVKNSGKDRKDIFNLRNIIFIILQYVLPLLIGILFINLSTIK